MGRELEQGLIPSGLFFLFDSTSRADLEVLNSAIMSQCIAATYSCHVHGVIPLRMLFYKISKLRCYDMDCIFVFDGPARPEMKNGRKVSKKNEPTWYGACEIVIKAFGYHVHKVRLGISIHLKFGF